jgi:hypothetical protein
MIETAAQLQRSTRRRGRPPLPRPPLSFFSAAEVSRFIALPPQAVEAMLANDRARLSFFPRSTATQVRSTDLARWLGPELKPLRLIGEVARVLRVSPARVRRKIAEGVIRVVRLFGDPRSLRVTHAELCRLCREEVLG